MTFEQVFEKIKTTFSNIEKIETKPDPYIKVESKEIYDVIQFLKIKLNFQSLASITGFDYPDKNALAVAYHPVSYSPAFLITLKTFLPRDSNPKLKSICDIYKAANWLEREVYDMFGIIFEGHPNLSRILLPVDWQGYPLRKDYITPNFYHGIQVPLLTDCGVNNE